jgi:hypothetical protein
VLIACTAVLVRADLHAAEAVPPEPEKKVGFVSGPAARGPWLEGAYTAKDGTRYAHGALLDGRIGRDRTIAAIVTYPDLYVDDIVPVWDYLYRVTEIVDSGEPKGVLGRDSVGLEWVENRKLPRGITFQPGSFAVPLTYNGEGGGAMYNNAVDVLKIEPSKAGAVAEITVVGNSKSTVRVRAGDVLTIGKARHKIRNVVPRDKKTHVIGWVEIDPDPLKEEKTLDKGGKKSSRGEKRGEKGTSLTRRDSRRIVFRRPA